MADTDAVDDGTQKDADAADDGTQKYMDAAEKARPHSAPARSCLKCGSRRRYGHSPESGRSPPRPIPGRRVSFEPPLRDDLLQGWAELFSFRCCTVRKPSRQQSELPVTRDFQKVEGFSQRWD